MEQLRRKLNKEFRKRVFILHEPTQPSYFLFFDKDGEQVKEVFYYTKTYRNKLELIVDRKYEDAFFGKRVLYLN